MVELCKVIICTQKIHGEFIMARIGLIGVNSIRFVEELIDIWNNGDCAVLIDPRTPLSALFRILEETDIKTCIVQKEYSHVFEMITNITIKIYCIEDSEIGFLPECVYNRFCSRYDHDDAIVIYSSGTTGKSKGVILSHYAINTNSDSIIQYMKPNSSDVFYICKSITHSSTLTGELLVALKIRSKVLIAPIVVPPRFILNQISKNKVSLIGVSPKILEMLVNEFILNKTIYDISNLKAIYVSGSILSDYVYEKAHSCFGNIGIFNVYGLTEAAPRVSAQRIECCKTNSVGKPINGVQVKIVDDYGKIVAAGEKGIVHVNTPCLFSGYTVGDVKNASLYNGWLNTGDIGFMDEYDELHICGRIDDVIIINSHKVYPQDVEKIIIEKLGVEECVVVLITHKKSDYLICLYNSNQPLDANVRIKLREYLFEYEIPYCFFKCLDFPISNNGKMLRNEAKLIAEKMFKQMYVKDFWSY